MDGQERKPWSVPFGLGDGAGMSIVLRRCPPLLLRRRQRLLLLMLLLLLLLLTADRNSSVVVVLSTWPMGLLTSRSPPSHRLGNRDTISFRVSYMSIL